MSFRSYAEDSNNAPETFSPVLLAASESAENLAFDKTIKLVKSVPLAVGMRRPKMIPSRDKRSRILRGRTKASY